MLFLTLIICFFMTVILTPVVKMLAFKIGATDKPNNRKVHQNIMPRLGGLAIFLSFIIGLLIIKQPDNPHHLAILLGGLIILLTGMLDDIKEITPKIKLLGQLIAAIVVVTYGGISVEFINLPFDAKLEFGLLSIPITIIWIIGVTNAINLIDGLDGLAAGVSSIALLTIAGMALLFGQPYVMVVALILAISTAGFLVFNFFPAKIFMGDSGALFLGYMIGVLALLGFKNVTFISLIIPVVILGVPISDTLFAIVRRIVNKKPLSAPDKSHLHHCLLRIGYSHRQTVLIIYAMSAIFGLSAFIFSIASIWVALLLLVTILIAVEIIVEKIGLIGEDYKPLLNFINGLRPITSRNK
ncbi:glycosyltransferase family 4 protein [Bacillus sp. DJP31]|uniref:glycosyltransferase family 4 protein n=1 Tax=Bacillus sp. DJP31 TaxID=3409789 RepID=UPI003BB6AA3C